MDNQAAQTPLEDLRKRALEHYEESSISFGYWSSSIPKAINYYYDQLIIKEKKMIYYRKFRYFIFGFIPVLLFIGAWIYFLFFHE